MFWKILVNFSSKISCKGIEREDYLYANRCYFLPRKLKSVVKVFDKVARIKLNVLKLIVFL